MSRCDLVTVVTGSGYKEPVTSGSALPSATLDRLALALSAMSDEDQRAVVREWNTLRRDIADRLEARRLIVSRMHPCRTGLTP